MFDQTALQIGGFLVQFFVFVTTLAFGLIRNSRSLREAITSNREMFINELSNMRKDQIERENSLQRNVGESLFAVRQKITDVEIWSRDTFVRQQDFSTIIASINVSLNNLGEKVDERIDKLEGKLDKIIINTKHDK